ncbi:hypothetical protein PV325_006213 [Microctonus aethiopoides]|nr:hypothetical protein PV325_006213 [Microctonus aethiopoides]KAK0079985.1 hypothetical protein PV326_008431 [Microctonus aethiopoides]
MESIQQQRDKFEEERKQIMDILVKEHVQSMENHQLENIENVNSVHRMKCLENRYKEITQQIDELQKCEDTLRNAKIQKDSDSNAMKDFYSELESFIKSHCDNLKGSDELLQLKKFNDSTNLSKFTDEEEYGKYLDLHKCYQQYINLEGIEKISYTTYVSTFDHLFNFPRSRKNSQYVRYLKAISSYLNDYFMRIQPLENINNEMKKVEIEFEVQWENDTFPGWSTKIDNEQIDIEENSKSNVLLSWEELKKTLNDLELKSDDNNREKVQDVIHDTENKVLFHSESTEIKNKKIRPRKDVDTMKKIAKLEAKVYRLVYLVSVQRLATIKKVLQKQNETNVGRIYSNVEKSDGKSQKELNKSDTL